MYSLCCMWCCVTLHWVRYRPDTRR